MAQLITEMQSGQLESRRVVQLMTELAQRLRNTSGKKQYGYLSPPLKSLVDERKSNRCSRWFLAILTQPLRLINFLQFRND